MDLGLTGRGAIVTGASRGIGRAIALSLAKEGAHVAICARGEQDLAATQAELSALGATCHAAVCDVSDVVALERFLGDAHAALGGVAVLVNNVSAFGMADDEESWRASLDVDLMAAVRATWTVVPWMTAAGGGSIVHVASIAGLESGWSPAYAASKAALVSHASTMAARLAPDRIRVNAVAPGSIEFPGGAWDRARQHNPERYASFRATVPAGRFGTPEEVGDVVAFLASERAGWITGTCLVVDGGQHKANH